ncbi:MAG: ATP-binding cassette domain-containing protein [Proteobacteria bacterium]|nr:ATP-binding cassette domain-containing protein [Pseudomonadota bacterium]
MNASALEFRAVDILFCARQGRRAHAAAIQQALAQLDAGGTRTEIAERTSVVVGVAQASLSVARGEISVLMGLSGSGKSTLLRAANGLNAVTRGQVLVADGDATVDIGVGCDPKTLRHIRRRRIAMVFQQFALLPWRTVRDNVGFGLELRGDPPAKRREIIDRQLQLVGLTQWAERYTGELSGGMQQRVGLARAFATDADILLMDEPFSALDPLIRRKLQDELLALQERVRKTILFVSHDLDEALKLGDRVTIMEGGRIVQTGTGTDIVQRPADAYVAEFVRHVNPNTAIKGAALPAAG